MKNLKLITLFTALTFLSNAQNDSHLYYKSKDNSTDKVYKFDFIDPNKANSLGLDFSIDPKILDDVDGFTIYVDRDGVSSDGYFKLTTEQFKSISKPCTRIEGNSAIFPRLFDYTKDANDGNGHFMLEIHEKPMGAAYILSKKGMDYSVNNEVEEYTLTVYANTYKIIRYDQEWVNSENRYRDVPVYDPNPKIIVAPIKIKVKTTDKIAPMGQSNNVRDVNELKAIFGEGK